MARRRVNKLNAVNRILTVEQAQQVHEYAVRLLSEVGCSILCPEALDILGKAGCDVSSPVRVKIPRSVLMDAISASPERIDVYNRDGERAMVFQTGACYYGTGSDCPTTIDLDSGERRSCRTDDIGRLARFSDSLPNIDFVMSFGIANDAPGGSNFIHQYEAMLLNTAKPIIVTGHGRNDMHTMIEMASTAAGGIEAVHAKPPLILYTEPLSPLTHTEMGVAKALVCCEHGIPFVYIGSPMMGASSPATLEGTLVQAVAESLSGLAIFQSKKPGAKFIFGGDATVLDPREGQFSYGAPELNVLNAALADMAHFYGLPFFCIAGASDAKVLDAQAGAEYALSLLGASMNGCNIIHDCGYLESGLTSSFESVLFADEIIGTVKHMMRPMNFNDETVPLPLFEQVGPGGNFLAQDHTVENYRKSFWFPRFLNRANYASWKQAGGKDLREELRSRARQLFQDYHPQRLSPQKEGEIHQIVSRHRADTL